MTVCRVCRQPMFNGVCAVGHSQARPPAMSGPPPPGAVPQDPAPGGLLTVSDLGHLRMAGRWGLLRPQNGKRFMVTGLLSLPITDLHALLAAAGGRLDPRASLSEGEVEVLVVGEDANEVTVGLAEECFVEVLSEAELVLSLLPRLEALVTPEAEPPF